MNSSNLPSIHAVVVTFNADPTLLEELLQKIAAQVERTVVVDNGSEISPSVTIKRIDSKSAIDLIELEENYGLGVAQNTGIRKAAEHGAQFVIIFDQDSDPSEDMVEKLLAAHGQKTDEGYQVAAVGPRFVDERNADLSAFVKLRGLRLRKMPCREAHGIIEVDHLISSGSLISVSTIEQVGMMREDLFIDYVDIEWCLRAKLYGYVCFGVCNAQMKHSLGERPMAHHGSTHTNHSPMRQYYIFRNRVFLYKQGWIPFRWKVADGFRLMLRYGFYTTLLKSKFAHWTMMHAGILDGLRSRLGKTERKLG